MIIANKIDLDDAREITEEEGRGVAKILKCEYQEMSIKYVDIKVIKKIFDELGEIIMSKIN